MSSYQSLEYVKRAPLLGRMSLWLCLGHTTHGALHLLLSLRDRLHLGTAQPTYCFKFMILDSIRHLRCVTVSSAWSVSFGAAVPESLAALSTAQALIVGESGQAAYGKP
ncbi:MAG: hypothetical protein IV107_11705 [Paucibacter sp.]|nr:hypothetical protein [Roseateles sp.]